jgi:hypothetical protein
MADPAYQWLSAPARWLLAVPLPWGKIGIVALPIGISLAFHPLPTVLLVWGVYIALMPLLGPLLPGAPGVVRRALGRRIVRRRALAAAAAIDGATIDSARDGAAVFTTGRVRARRQLAHRVDGKACVGVSIECRAPREEIDVDMRNPYDRGTRSATFRTRWYPARYETLHDFELEAADGRLILVRAAGARLLARPNVDFLGDDVEERLLIGALELPLGVVESPRGVFALRDGDLVTLVGFKSAVVDPDSAHGDERNPAIRSAIVSSSSMPVLIIPAVD